MLSALYMEREKKNVLEFYWIIKGNLSGGLFLPSAI